MTKPYARLHTWIWVCLYAGLLPQPLAAFMTDRAAGMAIHVAGGVLVAIGLGLLAYRTTRKDL
jgi:hypothetical protein